MPEAIRLLRQEHADMAMLLDVLERQLTVFKGGKKPDYDIIKAVLDYFLSYPDLYHHPKEDLIYLRLRVRDSVKAEALAELLSGHEDLFLLTRRFARATLDQILNPTEVQWPWFTSLGRKFIDINRHHMAKEEEHFFPLVLRVLTPEDWAAIDAQITDRADPLFGGTVELRFQDLHRTILELEHDSLKGHRDPRTDL